MSSPRQVGPREAACTSAVCRALSSEIDVVLRRALADLPVTARRSGAHRVWLDVGTWRHTLTAHDLSHDRALISVGLEALLSNLNASTHPTTPRFVRVHGACANQRAGDPLTFHVHTSPSCGLLPYHLPPDLPLISP